MTSVTCTNCGTANPWTELHCLNCGVALAEAKRLALADGVSPPAPAPGSSPSSPRLAASAPVARLLDLPDEMLSYLETLSRSEAQLEYVLDRSYVTIGRARTNDIVIDNSFVGWLTTSPYHAELRYQDGKFVVVDKQSDNGTFVNRLRVASKTLENGMTLSFGKVEFIYHSNFDAVSKRL
jgi:hypothetical protein